MYREDVRSRGCAGIAWRRWWRRRASSAARHKGEVDHWAVTCEKGKELELEVGAVELTVMTAVTGAVPVMSNELEATLHVGTATAPVGKEASAQER